MVRLVYDSGWLDNVNWGHARYVAIDYTNLNETSIDEIHKTMNDWILKNYNIFHR